MPRTTTTTTTSSVANPSRQSQRIANRLQPSTLITTTTTTTTTTTSSSPSSSQQAIDRKEKKEKRTKKPAKSNNQTSDNKENTNNNTLSSPTSDQVEPCGICFEAPEVKGKIDTCEHTFCFECINTWGKKENSCPLCKSRFHSITKIHLKQPVSGKRKRSSVVRVRNRNQQPVYQSIPWQNFGDDDDDDDDSDFDDQADDALGRLIFDNFNLQSFHFRQFASFSQFPNLDQDLDELETELEVEGFDTEDFNSFRDFVHRWQGLEHNEVDDDDDEDEDLDEEDDEEEIDEDEDSDSEIREIEQIVIDDYEAPPQRQRQRQSQQQSQPQRRQPPTYNIERDEFGRELILIDDCDDNTVNNSTRQTRIRRR